MRNQIHWQVTVLVFGDPFKMEQGKRDTKREENSF